MLRCTASNQLEKLVKLVVLALNDCLHSVQAQRCGTIATRGTPSCTPRLPRGFPLLSLFLVPLPFTLSLFLVPFLFTHRLLPVTLLTPHQEIEPRGYLLGGAGVCCFRVAPIHLLPRRTVRAIAVLPPQPAPGQRLGFFVVSGS